MATENTGYKAFAKLLKITDDGTARPLDVNNNLCIESGLPQAFKDNIESDPDYVAPVYDTTACPLPNPCTKRNLTEVQLTGHYPEVITLSYVNAVGTGVNQTWTVGGTGEELYHSFAVGTCVVESSVGIDGGTLIANFWNDSVDCCAPAPLNYCAVWSAKNEGNIRMSTSGYLDFTEQLAGKNINNTGGASVGAISAYKFAGDSAWTSTNIPFSFTSKRATWDTNALHARTDQVLTGIRFSFEIITTPYSEISVSNIELFAEVTGGTQITSSYDSCSTET